MVEEIHQVVEGHLQIAKPRVAATKEARDEKQMGMEGLVFRHDGTNKDDGSSSCAHSDIEQSKPVAKQRHGGAQTKADQPTKQETQGLHHLVRELLRKQGLDVSSVLEVCPYLIRKVAPNQQ